MKKKFSKILGVGLTLALLASFLVMGAPVSADVGQPSVVLDEYPLDEENEGEISAVNLYTITFDVNDEVPVPTVLDFDFDDGDDGSAGWSAAGVAHSGAYSVLLDAGSIPGDPPPYSYGRVNVYLPIPTDPLDRPDLADFTDNPTFYADGVIEDGDDPWNDGPYLNILLDVTPATATAGTYDTGLEGVIATSSEYTDGWDLMESVEYYMGSHITYNDEANTQPLSWWAAQTGIEDYKVVGVMIQLGKSNHTAVDQVVYIDDVTIGGTTYNLDWGFDENENDVADADEFGAIDAGTITIEFPEGTVVDDDWDNADVEVRSTEEFGDANAETDVGNHVVTTEDDDVYTVTIGLEQLQYAIAEGARVRVKFLGDQITNPDEAGDYTLWVSTSEETDLVESAEYEIEVPEISGLPGVVSVYNPSGILMASYTGGGAVEDAIDKADDEDWVIKLGPGTYGTNDTFAAYVEGVTIKAVGDVTWEGVASIIAADVVIEGITFDGDGEPIAVTVTDAGTGVSFEDCAFEDADILLQIDADDIAIEDCTFTIGDGIGIDVRYTVVGEEEEETTPPTITDCTFTVEEDGDGVGIEINADIEVTGCTFTVEEEGVGIEVNGGVSAIEGCTFDGLETVLDIDAGIGTVDFFGNTIQDCTDVAILVDGAGKVLIHNNTITGSDDEVILDVADGAAASVSMLFNDITDNAGDDDGLLIDNNDTGVDLYVINNWWGDADGPSQGEDAFSDDVVYEPFLTASVSDSVIDAAVAIDDGLDAEDECGVTVTADKIMDIVGASKYAENPAADIDDAIGFWDVCMIDDDVTSVTIRFYTDVTEDTEVYVWGAARGEWLQCDPDIAVPNLFSGFIAVTVGAATSPTLDDLGALPFAVVEPPAEAEIDEAPEIAAPANGADDISLTPTFSWSAVDDADGYYFEFADNANFVTPLVKLDGDLGRLIVTAYAYVTELPYSTAYYWRVKAVSGTEAAGDLKESAWVSGVFITKAEPVEPTPPVVVEPYEPPIITIEQPDIVVPLPAETPITPAWIYVIIGVGAVLVIGLIVLIVRTRRVA